MVYQVFYYEFTTFTNLSGKHPVISVNARTARALSDYIGQDSTELNFFKGDIISVLDWRFVCSAHIF